jgi:signal peptidase I
MKISNPDENLPEKNAPRHPILAMLLSLPATGLGHIYCGDLTKGLILFFASFAFAPIIVVSAKSAASTVSLIIVIASIALLIFIFFYALVDAYRLGRIRSTHYRLKEYNRWPIYILFIIVSMSYPTNLAHSIRSHLLEAFKIPSTSMAPNILPGDYLFLNKVVYKTKAPQCGEVVIFIYPDDRHKHFIKRIVALPGETVEIKNGHVIINDQPLTYEAVKTPIQTATGQTPSAVTLIEHNSDVHYRIMTLNDDETGGNMAKITVPHGYCFVLGDNRSESKDSRHFGPIPLADVLGRVDYIYWPAQSWSRFGRYRD